MSYSTVDETNNHQRRCDDPPPIKRLKAQQFSILPVLRRVGTMNYLTAIIATPLFVLVWLFEVRLYLTSSPRILKEGKDVVALAYAASTLQMVSCWFWLFGFVLGKTDSLLSEAIGEGEYGNCVGLVGAEVLLSVFQYLTSIFTLLQMFVVRFVYTSSASWKVGAVTRSRGENAVLAAAVVLGLAYLPITWITAWNRRCPQRPPVWPAVQHYFYSTFLVVDGVTSSFALFYARDIQRRLSRGPTSAASAQLGKSSDVEEGAAISGKKASSSNRKVTELAQFFQFQCQLTIVGVLLAISFFVLQFGVRLSFLSVVACVFCTLMYATYALRRVPMLMKYLRDDHSWLPKSWQSFWDTRSRSPNMLYTSTGSTVDSKVTKSSGWKSVRVLSDTKQVAAES